MADIPVYANDDSNLAESGKVFLTNFQIDTVETTEIPIILFRNPSGSGKVMRLIRFTFSNVHTSDSYIRIRAYVAPTVTSDGTTVSAGCSRIGGASGSAEVFSTPTVSANGVRIGQWLAPAFQPPTQIALDYLIILDPNTTILLTAQADGNNRSFAGSFIWAEV